MDSINGVSLKKLIELALAIVALILILTGGTQNKEFMYFIILCIALAYLSLIVVMACLSRDIGASPAIEGASGLMLTAYSIGILNTGLNRSTQDMAAVICTLVLGVMLLVFLLF